MAGRPSISETDELLMKYLQSPPVQRFQYGGMSENPEGDYYEGGDEDPAGPSPYTGGKTPYPYRGVYRELQAKLNMMKQVMQAIGVSKELWDIFNAPPKLPGGFAGPISSFTDVSESVNMDGIWAIGDAIGSNPELAEDLAGITGSLQGSGVVGVNIGNIMNAVNSGATIGSAVGAGIKTAAISALQTVPVVMALTYIVGKAYQAFRPDQTPFIFQKMDFMRGRGGDHAATYKKLMADGYDPNDSLFTIFRDTVRTAQDYYEFRDKYFVGNFETDTFRKDLGFTDENFYPLEEPDYEMLGDLKIYVGENDELNAAVRETSGYINDLVDEGYSELRIMEDLGIELDPAQENYFKRADLTELKEARESGDTAEYVRLLSGMSTEIGEKADEEAYQKATGIRDDMEARRIARQMYPYGWSQEQFDEIKYANYDPDADPDGEKSFIYDSLRSLKDDMADAFDNGNFTDEQIIENNKWLNDLITAGIQAGGTMSEIVAGAGRYAKWANNAFKKALESGDIDPELIDKVMKAAPGIMGIAELIPDELLNKADEYSKTLNAIGNAKSSDELKAGLERFDAILDKAKKRALERGADVSDTAVLIGEAWTEAIAEEPYAFFMNKILVESFEEFAPFIAGAAGKIARTGAKNLFEEFGSKQIQEWAKNLDPKDAGLFEAKAADLIEVISLEANGAYEESKALATNKEAEHIQKLQKARGNEITLEEAIELIDDDTLVRIEEEAQMDGFSTGTVAAFSNMILNKELGGTALIDSIFKDAAKGIDGGMKSVRQYFTEKVAMLAKEGFTESLEEAIPAWFKNGRFTDRGLKEEGQALVDTIDSFFGGFFTGIGTSGTISTVDDIANIPKNTTEHISNIVKTTNAEVKSILEGARQGAINQAEAMQAMEMFGITTDEYGALQTQLLNDPFDADFTTVGEVTQSFENANPDYEATDETIGSYVGQNSQAELDATINEFVDQNYVDADEVRAIAEAEGLSLTDEQIARYVQQVDDNGAEAKLADMTSVFDRQYTTEAEVRELLAAAGYDPDNPWASGESIDDILADLVGKPENSNLTDKVNETSLFELQLQFNNALEAGADASDLDLLLDRIETLDTDSTLRTDSNLDDSGGTVDPDSDNDGIPDSTDEFPNDPWNGNPPPDSDAFPDKKPPDDTVDTSNQITWLEELPPVGQQIVRAMIDMGADPDSISKEDILATYFYDGRPNQRLISQFFTNYSKYKSNPPDDVDDDVDDDDVDDVDDDDVDDNVEDPDAVTKDDLSDVKQTLLDKIAENEAAGMTRDEALQAAINELSGNLDLTTAELTDLISGVQETVGADIEAVASLVGKPVSEVTQEDIDFISNVIAEQEILADPSSYEFTEDQLLYDVTGDGVVNQEDQVLLEALMSGDTDTLAALDSKFAPTGLYEMLQKQNEQAQQDAAAQAEAQAQAQAQTEAQIEDNQRRSNISDLMQLLGGADDIAGQQVNVKAADPANIDYLYDFSSIFATPKQEQLFADPYGTNIMQSRNPVQPMQQGPQRTPLSPFGRNAGGLIDEDEFLRIVGGS